MSDTFFVDVNGLAESVGLDSIVHHRPSTLDLRTIRDCVSHLPEVFLLGVGYTHDEIENLWDMYPTGIRYYTCFISHCESDLPYANMLREDLDQHKVKCWRYKEDLRGGRNWRDQVNHQIALKDKLILVCSASSVYRPNVVHEILSAIDLERATGKPKLFPVRLDDHILGDEMEQMAGKNVHDGLWRDNWVTYVLEEKELHIPDFSGWDTDNQKYKSEFAKLLDALKASGNEA